MLQWIIILHGLVLALIDATVLPLLKLRFTHKVKGLWPLITAFIAYGSQTLIFFNSLRYETMTVMNVLWDVMSDVIVTIIGLFILKEVVTKKKIIGICFGFVSLYLLSS
jgi:drug/metabolite transporter (DMT)-like permease